MHIKAALRPKDFGPQRFRRATARHEASQTAQHSKHSTQRMVNASMPLCKPRHERPIRHLIRLAFSSFRPGRRFLQAAMFAVPAPSAGPIKRMSRIGATRLISLITQGNRLRPVGAPRRDLCGSWAGAVPNPSAMSPLAPFLSLMIRAIAAGAAWRVRRRGWAGMTL